MSTRTIEVEKLEKWYLNFITTFREEYEKLSDIEKKIASMNFNFLSPCQIEVFWLKEPQFQLTVRTNFKDRPDKEIIVNGPYSSHEFIDKVDSSINQPKWQIEINNPDEEWIYHHKGKYSEALARDFYAMIYYAKEYPFTANKSEQYGRYRISDMVGTSTWAGNISDKDYLSEVRSDVNSIKSQATVYEDYLRQEKAGLLPKPPAYKPQAYGIHLFPPVVIGTKPQFSSSDILRGRWISLQYEKAFDIRFNDIAMIVERNGFIVVGTPDKRLALKILNTVMAVGVLHDFPFFAVREHELGDAGYNKESLTIGGFSYEQNTLRSGLFNEGFWRERLDLDIKEMKESILQDIIEESSKIFENEKLIDEIGLFLESFTHFRESEFGQSFLMSWIVIERYLYQMWENWWKDKLANGEKIPNLFVERVLQFLKSNGQISKEEYLLYDNLRDIRNGFIHSGNPIGKEEAKICLDEATRIIKNKIYA